MSEGNPREKHLEYSKFLVGVGIFLPAIAGLVHGVFFREWWILIVAFSLSVLALYLEHYALGPKSDPYRVIFWPNLAEELRKSPATSGGIVRAFFIHSTLVILAFLLLWAYEGLYLHPSDWNTSEIRTTEGVVVLSRNMGSSSIVTIRYAPEGLGDQEFKLSVVGPRLETGTPIEVFYGVEDPKRSRVQGMPRFKLFDLMMGIPFALFMIQCWMRARVKRFSP